MVNLTTHDAKGRESIRPVASAIPACNGVVSGEIVLDAESARQKAAAGVSVILVQKDAQTADIKALDIASGLLTQRGARTSHAAVVARQLGKVCVVGCADLQINLERQSVMLAGTELPQGIVITLDGNAGAVYLGAVATVLVPDPELQPEIAAR